MDETIQTTVGDQTERSPGQVQQTALTARRVAMEAADRVRTNLGEGHTTVADTSGNLLSPRDQQEVRELGHNALK